MKMSVDKLEHINKKLMKASNAKQIHKLLLGYGVCGRVLNWERKIQTPMIYFNRQFHFDDGKGRDVIPLKIVKRFLSDWFLVKTYKVLHPNLFRRVTSRIENLIKA